MQTFQYVPANLDDIFEREKSNTFATKLNKDSDKQKLADEVEQAVGQTAKISKDDLSDL